MLYFRKRRAQYEERFIYYCTAYYLAKARGGGVLRLLISVFEGCKIQKICYNSDVDIHNYNGVVKMKKAFTLAEVLVTLGIIGVVAAMTMPTLINDQRNKALEAQFNTAHSMISQTLTQMGSENIDLTKMYCGASRRDQKENIFIRDFAKYFKVIKSEYGSTADLTKLGYKNSYFNQSAPGHNNFNPDSHDNGAIILSNGMMIASSGCWWTDGGVGIDFIVDTNGTKGPNKFGYDLFYFQFGDDNKLYPDAGDYMFATTDAKKVACCNFEKANTCSVPQDTGVACAQFALTNTWPHDEKKKYWDTLP